MVGVAVVVVGLADIFMVVIVLVCMKKKLVQGEIGSVACLCGVGCFAVLLQFGFHGRAAGRALEQM